MGSFFFYICAYFTDGIMEVRRMSRLELLMVLYSLRAFLNKKMYDDAMELIDKVIAQAEKS